jgi:hypothetical protein
VYKFMNLKTRKLVMSRNVIWLDQNYAEFKGIKAVNVEQITPVEVDQEEVEEEIEPEIEEVENNNTVPATPRTPAGRLSRELKGLMEFNRDPVTTGETAEVAMLSQAFGEKPFYGEKALISGFDDGADEPKNFKEMSKHKNRKEWWDAMCTEFHNMENKEVWTIRKRKDKPPNRKLIGNRWVYKKKDNGTYRARTVAKGYDQVPGKDFQENHAPVVNDTTFRITLILKILLELESEQFDVETAFLYGDLDEEIWMEFPEGYVDYLQEVHKRNYEESEWCVELGKAIYGLVQAARQWWKKFKEAMGKLGFKPSLADPCLFTRKEGNEWSFVIIYVDDGGIIATRSTIKAILEALGNEFVIKVLGPLKHFVGCHIIENDQKDTIWIHQPNLLRDLKGKFGEIIGKGKPAATPGAPKTTVMRPQEGDVLIGPEMQTQFRSGVGMLLYLIKHSRPEISNPVRELTKVVDGATHGHWKAMQRTIKYVLDTENYALKIKPNKKNGVFTLGGVSDSEFGGDKDTRISVYGYLLFFCGALIAWKSKAGKSVTLSSTEAEYFGTSELAKEVIFAKQILETMGVILEFPIIIEVDNTGAIYIANNYTTGQRTKHIDIRAHFVREFIEDGVLKVVFVRSEDNGADIYTKNTTEFLFEKHSSKYMEDVTTRLGQD